MTISERHRDTATKGLMLVDLLGDEARRVVRYAAHQIALIAEFEPDDEHQRSRQYSRATQLADVIDERLRPLERATRPSGSIAALDLG